MKTTEDFTIVVRPIGYYLTTLTPEMIAAGQWHPTFTQCCSTQEVLDLAKEQVAMGMDKKKTSFHCIIVYSDGTLCQRSIHESDLDF